MFTNSLETELRRAMWKRRLRVVVIAAAVFAAPFAAFEGWRAYLRLDPEWRYVEDVLLDSQFGEKDRTVSRWATRPEVRLLDATEDDTEFINGMVSEVNDLLRGSGLQVVSSESDVGDLTVMFRPKATIPKLAEEYGGHHVTQAKGYYVIFPADRFEIERAIAIIGSELTGDERRATIVHEFVHSLGLVGHSAAFRGSVVFEDVPVYSSATTLSPTDRRALRFLYMSLRPGYGWWQVRTAFTHSWPDD